MLKLIKLKKVLGDDLFNKLKGAFDDETPATDPIVEETFVGLADGSGKISGTIAEGETIAFTPTDGESAPIPDGDYILESGETITCSGSVITAITAAEPAEQPMTEQAVLAAIQTAVSLATTEFTKQIAELKATHANEIKATKANFSAILEAMDMLAETKADEPEQKADPKQKAAAERTEKFNQFLEMQQSIKSKNK